LTAAQRLIEVRAAGHDMKVNVRETFGLGEQRDIGLCLARILRGGFSVRMN
jgi:hypothetical protein